MLTQLRLTRRAIRVKSFFSMFPLTRPRLSYRPHRSRTSTKPSRMDSKSTRRCWDICQEALRACVFNSCQRMDEATDVVDMCSHRLLGTPVTGDSPPPETSQLVKTFQISGEYCVPKEPGPKASTLQVSILDDCKHTSRSGCSFDLVLRARSLPSLLITPK